MTPRSTLPYAHLNLRTNPFRALDAEERRKLAVVDVEAWVRLVGSRLRKPSTSVRPSRSPSVAPATCLLLQLLGPGGCGKTTHLEALHRRFPDAPLVSWSACDGWPPMPPGDLLFLDDAHELAGRDWPETLAGRRVVVAATRRDLRVAVPHGTRRGDAGIELLTASVAHRATPDDVRKMVARRMEWARRGPAPIPSVDDAVLESLMARHGSDLRALTDDLYRHIQDHPPVVP